MNLNFTSIITLGVLSTSSAWVSKPNNFSKTIFKSNQVNGKFREGTKITAEEQSSSESSSDHLPSDAPCWQDFYDDDCGMSAIYASNFVAKDWIKSMPCAKGLEVSKATNFFF